MSGRVTDAATHAPLPRAEVSLLDSTGKSVTVVRATDRGDYLVRPPALGRYRLAARRIGYRSALSSWFLVESADASLTFDFALDVAPQTLGTVATEAEAADPTNVRGRFGVDAKNINAFTVSPEKVREWTASATGIADVLRRIGIPGGLAVREDSVGEPCIVLIGRDRHCMLIVVDDIVSDHVRDLDLQSIQDIVVMRPNEAGFWFGSLSSGGGVRNPNARSTAGGVLIIRTRIGPARKEKEE